MDEVVDTDNSRPIVRWQWSVFTQHVLVTCVNKPITAQSLRTAISPLPEQSQLLVSLGYLYFGFGKWSMVHLCLVESIDCLKYIF